MIDLEELSEKTPAKELENQYRRLFTAKYKLNPAISYDDKQVFEWLAKEYGAAKSNQLLDAYFKLNDGFISQRGHAARFLKTNINQVIASIGNKIVGAPRQAMHLSIRVWCDRCGQQFAWVGPAADMDKKHFCELCE